MPNGYAHYGPEQRSPTDYEPETVIWQELPNATREYDQAKAAEGCSCSIRACRLTASNYSAHAFLLFAFALVLFHQGDAAGENRRKSKEQSTEAGTEFFGDHSCTSRYQAAQNKSQQELPPFRPLQSGCADGNDHRGQLTITYQSPVATPIQTIDRTSAAGNAETLNRMRM
jgi:hypothetical protein